MAPSTMARSPARGLAALAAILALACGLVMPTAAGTFPSASRPGVRPGARCVQGGGTACAPCDSPILHIAARLECLACFAHGALVHRMPLCVHLLHVLMVIYRMQRSISAA